MSNAHETQALLQWYQIHKRDLPWRENQDPYRVWVSEVMLQQTRVEAVRNYFLRFMQEFPTIVSLADADLTKVYKVWEGLGYYSRARRLWEAAQTIKTQYHGIFPTQYDQILALPGIGAYTAGAIASICFGMHTTAVDGNVMRVISRLRGVREQIEMPSTHREILQYVKALLPQNNTGDFNQALMELGALVCIPANPKCELCPWMGSCDAYEAGDASSLPYKAPKKAKKEQRLQVAILLCGQYVLLRKRAEKGLLQGLWEFPYDLSAKELALLQAHKEMVLPPHRHVFTHLVWDMMATVYNAKSMVQLSEPYRWVDAMELSSLPIPTAMAVFRKVVGDRLL